MKTRTKELPSRSYPLKKSVKKGVAKASNTFPIPNNGEETVKIVIRDGIPIPKLRINTDIVKKFRDAIDSMAVKQSFEYDKKYQNTVYYIILNEYHTKKNGRAFITRKVSNTLRGIWRVK
jgi:hypothetical protein